MNAAGTVASAASLLGWIDLGWIEFRGALLSSRLPCTGQYNRRGRRYTGDQCELAPGGNARLPCCRAGVLRAPAARAQRQLQAARTVETEGAVK
jgi:hypothetical protein